MARRPDAHRMLTTRAEWGWRVELFPADGGDALSWCSVVDVRLRIGAAPVLTGGIGGVGTQEAHRRRGYSRRVMEAALELMRREAYPISFLHGIQDFYDKFGYVTCMAEHEFSLQTAVLAAGRHPGGLRLRRLKQADLPAVARLYNAGNARRTGSAVRDPRAFGGFRKGTWWTYRAGVRVAVDPGGRIVGYVVYDDVEQHVRASEVAGADAATFDLLAAFLARRARRLGHAAFHVHAPADEPFAVYCRRYGARAQTLFPRNEKPMGRVIDLAGCLRAILPELAQRWGRPDRDRPLALRTDIGAATLGWRGGRLRLDLGAHGAGAVRLDQRALTLLLFGYARADDLLAWGEARIPRDRRDLLARLFPLQEAQLWWTDRF